MRNFREFLGLERSSSSDQHARSERQTETKTERRTWKNINGNAGNLGGKKPWNIEEKVFTVGVGGKVNICNLLQWKQFYGLQTYTYRKDTSSFITISKQLAQPPLTTKLPLILMVVIVYIRMKNVVSHTNKQLCHLVCFQYAKAMYKDHGPKQRKCCAETF